ncbi:GYF domain-containing protein [Lignipirellula cremea]|uniref:GYF domain-containing protein n=1 Tax=Lignipirellula cremea TaxID=2528010 RepID=UPI0018D1F8FA|nr:GYF domain-containing protein [Lignipirellula cremea]
MSGQWYVNRQGDIRGPLSLAQLQAKAHAGQLTAADSVCRDGMKDWIAASELPALVFPAAIAPSVAPTRSVPTGPPPLPAAAERKTTERPQPVRRTRPLAPWLAVLAVAGLLLAILGLGLMRQRATGPIQQAAPAIASRQTEPTRLTGRLEMANPPSSEPAVNEQTTARTDDARPRSGPISPPPSAPAEEETATEAPASKTLAPLKSRDEPVRPGQATEPVVSAVTADAPQDSQQTPVAALASQSPERVLFVEVDVSRQSKMTVQGLPIAGQSRYRLLSQFDLGPADSQGVRVVTQTVLATRLEACDELSRGALAPSLARLKGQRYTFQLNEANEVSGFAGAAALPESAAVDALGGSGLVLVSAMDDDGFAELAQSAFFPSPARSQVGQQWQRPMHHDWGPLGSWQGETHYEQVAPQNAADTFEFTYHLRYAPPDAAAASGLPFTPTRADFKTLKAGGVIHFDRKLNRVATAVEHFHAQGELVADLLGQSTTLQVEEVQQMQLRLYDQNPWPQAGQEP